MCLFARSCSRLQPIEPTVDPNMSASLEERECEPAKVIVAVKITSRARIPRCSLPFFPRPMSEAHHVAAFRTGDSRSAGISLMVTMRK
jgi:hypothetical protein